MGAGGLGNSGNARKKTFFFQWISSLSWTHAVKGLSDHARSSFIVFAHCYIAELVLRKKNRSIEQNVLLLGPEVGDIVMMFTSALCHKGASVLKGIFFTDKTGLKSRSKNVSKI